jgi:nucleotide-binding universal stress UspA family protein
MGGTGVLSYDERIVPALAAEAQATVDRAIAQLRDSGLQAEGLVARGDPRVEIVSAATEWRADLIVVGSHGRTGLKRWVLGSVAEYVVRHSPCSVEVVRRAHSD